MKFGTPWRKSRYSVLLLAGALLLGACGQEKPESLIKSAREYIAKKDFAAASIQLKNALQRQENGEAHFLLATTLIEQGELGTAELHLRRALDSGYAPDTVYAELAKVMVDLGDFKKVVTELGGVNISDQGANAVVKAATGEAYFAMGQPADAKQAFAAALTSNAGELRAQIGEARIMAAQGDIVRATSIVGSVLANTPRQPQALALKADLLVSQSKLDDAVAVLTTLINVAPYNGQARFALVSLLIAGDKLEQAAAGIAAMKKALPRDIRSRYLEAVLAFRKAQPIQARDAVLQVLNVLPDHGPSLLLAGAAEYQLGSLSTAENHLRKVLAKYPQSLYTRNLLIATYLRKGQPLKAEDTLAPGLRQAPQDPTVLRAAGEVAFANNKFANAAKFYEQALALEKDSAALRTRLAQIRLATGETVRALEDLETASGLDKNAYQADLSLVSAYLSQNQFDKALAAVDTLEKKQPSNPLTYTTKASVYLAKQDIKNARASLERALSIQFNYMPAARILAGLDLADKNFTSATARFETILTREPANESALLSLAETQIAAKALSREVVATFERAIKANPTSTSVRIALVKFHTQNRDPQSALAAAQAAIAAMPNDPGIVDALGLAQLASGDTTQAIETFNKLALLLPDSPLPLMRLASAQYAAKQVDAPIQALRKALVLKPDLLEAQRQLIIAQLSAGRAEEALKETKSIQRARPKEAAGFAMEGDVLANQKKHAEAANAYAEAIKRQPDAELVVKQLQLLQAAGKTAEIGAVSSKWLQENPKDPVVRFHLANAAVSNNDHKNAIARYREILALQPENLAVLNNMAWVMSELQDPAAIEFAERALKIAPDNADVQDTYGWLLVNRGDAKRGAEVLLRAVAAAPKAIEPRLHLAKALLKSGDKAGGKRELETLATLVKGGPAKAEVERLLQSL
ncbi:MAG: PEP-CTERM system TPR-repeat protein PrsT [Betaproteobacteria bacterium]|nr:PEP-CTERM system TPR-repeat protein PrsT [Betaproteobacteria bacterium]